MRASSEKNQFKYCRDWQFRPLMAASPFLHAKNEPLTQLMRGTEHQFARFIYALFAAFCRSCTIYTTNRCLSPQNVLKILFEDSLAGR